MLRETGTPSTVVASEPGDLRGQRVRGGIEGDDRASDEFRHWCSYGAVNVSCMSARGLASRAKRKRTALTR